MSPWDHKVLKIPHKADCPGYSMTHSFYTMCLWILDLKPRLSSVNIMKRAGTSHEILCRGSAEGVVFIQIPQEKWRSCGVFVAIS